FREVIQAAIGAGPWVLASMRGPAGAKGFALVTTTRLVEVWSQTSQQKGQLLCLRVCRLDSSRVVEFHFRVPGEAGLDFSLCYVAAFSEPGEGLAFESEISAAQWGASFP